MKILNLYACLGGNRYKWDEVTNVEVTAVEWDEALAKLYKQRFPKDNVIVADAHQYLLDHYKEFDFIWSSPPCPTHSGTNWFLNAQNVVRYPEMSLYQEIIFLDSFFKTAPSMKAHSDRPANNWRLFSEFHKIDLTNYKGKQSKAKIARNLVDFEAGKTIFETACGILNKQDIKQTSLF